MKQHNLILTDIMKTGHHYYYGNYIKNHSLFDHDVTVIDDYYLLPNNLDSFKRKIAIICTINPWYMNNIEFANDLDHRIKKLSSIGFKFILASPWESRANTISNVIIKKYQSICIDTWYCDGDWFWFFMYNKHYKNKNSFQIDHTAKKYDFLYLNKQPREHRKLLFQKIQEANLLENSLWSFIGLDNPKRLTKEYEPPWIADGLITLANNNDQDQDIYERPYNHTQVNIITESNVNNNETFITEKVWKAIIMKQPFIVYGNNGTLTTLKEYGFSTFDNVFDESYDKEIDLDKKIDKIIALCKTIKNNNFKDVYKNTETIRENNFDNFFKKDNISKFVNSRLKKWFTNFEVK